MTVLLFISWFLLVLCSVGLACWVILLIRVLRITADPPRLRDGLRLAAELGSGREPWPSLSVIVPAHNEEADADACARSLRQLEYDPLEIIFVLDRCTDATRSILTRHAEEDPRIVIVDVDSCPPDWTGKCNAAATGAQRASGDWLLFSDADALLDPRIARSAVALALHHRLDLLSLLSILRQRFWFERIVQPVATMFLMRLYPPTSLRRTERTRAFANGQFMLFQRGCYERLGGHGSVKGDLLEDIALARRLQAEGARTGVAFSDGMLTCGMYDSFPDFVNGWKRIFIEACRRSAARIRKNALFVLAAAALPVIQLLATVMAALVWRAGDASLGITLSLLVLASLGTQFATLFVIYGLSGARRRDLVVFPVGCLLLARAMLEAATELTRRTPVRWAGRQYVLEPRG